MNAKVVTRVVGDDMILLDTASGNYFSLNAVASRIWAMMKAGSAHDVICQTLVVEFEVDLAAATHDVGAFEARLRSFKLSPSCD